MDIGTAGTLTNYLDTTGYRALNRRNVYNTSTGSVEVTDVNPDHVMACYVYNWSGVYVFITSRNGGGINVQFRQVTSTGTVAAVTDTRILAVLWYIP